MITCLKLWLSFHIIIKVLKKFLIELCEWYLHGCILAKGRIAFGQVLHAGNIKRALAEVVG
jgi:hypothetical protein